MAEGSGELLRCFWRRPDPINHDSSGISTGSVSYTLVLFVFCVGVLGDTGTGAEDREDWKQPRLTKLFSAAAVSGHLNNLEYRRSRLGNQVPWNCDGRHSPQETRPLKEV